MAGLIKELLLDFALNRVSVDLKSDLSIAIQNALLSGVFTIRDVDYFMMYLAGYSSIEIAAKCITTTAQVEQQLERIFTAIEEYSGYTDQAFIRKVELSGKYRKGGIRDLSTFLVLHSKQYVEHDMQD